MKSLSAFTLLFIGLTTLHAEVSFITEEEYASQLYHSPRGIGCFKCHGEKGEGKLIATYRDKGEKKYFSPPAINALDLETFWRAMKTRQKGMPRYFLTDKEIKALYLYLHPKALNDVN